MQLLRQHLSLQLNLYLILAFSFAALCFLIIRKIHYGILAGNLILVSIISLCLATSWAQAALCNWALVESIACLGGM